MTTARSTQPDEKEVADRWLAAELNRIWLVAERTLRAFQKAQIRPQPGHPSIAEVEGILAARRAARLGPGHTETEDEAALTKAIDDAESKLVALRKAAPIGRVIANMQLRPLEIETLVTVLAPHLDAPLSDIFAVVRGPGAGRRGVDLALVAQLFRLKRTDRVALLDAVDPDRPLLRWRLLHALPAESMEAFGSVNHRALRPTFDLLSALCGRADLAPELTRFTSLIRAEARLDDLLYESTMEAEVTALCEAARADATSSPAAVPWIIIWGPAAVGKRTLAARVAAYSGRPLIAFNPTVLDKGTFDDMFARVQRDALMRGATLYVGPLVPELTANGARELTKRLIGFNAPLIIGVEGFEAPRIVSEQPIRELHLRLPPEPIRAKLWNEAIPEDVRGPDLQLGSMARAFNLAPGEIVSAGIEARAIARQNSRKITHADVRGSVERRLRNDLGELARRITSVPKWSDLVLPREDMERIHEFISRKKYFDTVYNEWGFAARIGYGKGLIALFSGPPGTGKTMLAGLIGQALDLDLYQVDLAQVVSKWVGETEKQLGKVFDQAERAHAVLLFDEADSLFSKRTEVKTSNDRYANMAVNYLLQRLEQYTGVAVLTTNKDAALDEALQRRLTLHLHLEIPEVPERERLWKSFLPERAPIEADIDYSVLAKEFELSGGYIKNAAVRAAFLAAAHNAPIGMELLRLASALELEDMGRVVMQRGSRPGADGDPPSFS
ncbi:MAG: ATP-binding protein [Kofleriaceae bacterium]|nr:ATP-binding protein [Myxococcales bacterium]MCB9562595.1 ATP-binding protein [Kofleriaceae bacterium]